MIKAKLLQKDFNIDELNKELATIMKEGRCVVCNGLNTITQIDFGQLVKKKGFVCGNCRKENLVEGVTESRDTVRKSRLDSQNLIKTLTNALD
jgi:hypothetical protein